jgi:hypothetical protein
MGEHDEIDGFGRTTDRLDEALWPATVFAREMKAAALEHLKYVLSQDNSGDGSRFRVIANLLGREEDRRFTTQFVKVTNESLKELGVIK